MVGLWLLVVSWDAERVEGRTESRGIQRPWPYCLLVFALVFGLEYLFCCV